jgi:hypothetical protein
MFSMQSMSLYNEDKREKLIMSHGSGVVSQKSESAVTCLASWVVLLEAATKQQLVKT